MTAENWKIQVNVKIGDTLVNLRGENPAEVESILGWAEQNATTIASTIAALHAQGNVAAAFPGSQNVAPVQQYQQAAAAPQQGSWGDQGSQQAPPAFVPQQAAAGPGGPAPQCAHGAMTYREAKPGSGKSWKAYFCPTPQGTPGQCKPEFLK